jgi:diguanylate cyclase (GGDEF)-like protein
MPLMERDVDHGSAIGPASTGSGLISDAPGVEPLSGSADQRAGVDGFANSSRSRAKRRARRDENATLRDVRAGSRDVAAGQRDRAEEGQEALLTTEDARDSIVRELLLACSVGRDGAAADRAQAANDRRLAAEDLASASADGSQAQIERQRLRDANAGSRDVAAEIRDRAGEELERGLLAAEHTRNSTIRTLLVASGAGRDHAAADRAGSANDRHMAVEDRASASTDASHALYELEQARLDGLTGAQRRDLGSTNLQQVIGHARRSGEPFVLAFVDVDGLKELNDREGHAAGDALLQTVVVALKAQLRSSDPIVRLGGDEFLCGFTNTDLETSRRRVDQIRAGLANGSTKASISVGIATLGERDTLEMLIARADADMYSQKQRRPVGPELARRRYDSLGRDCRAPQ